MQKTLSESRNRQLLQPCRSNFPTREGGNQNEIIKIISMAQKMALQSQRRKNSIPDAASPTAAGVFGITLMNRSWPAQLWRYVCNYNSCWNAKQTISHIENQIWMCAYLKIYQFYPCSHWNQKLLLRQQWLHLQDHIFNCNQNDKDERGMNPPEFRCCLKLRSISL